jgi:hypothetical protein
LLRILSSTVLSKPSTWRLFKRFFSFSTVLISSNNFSFADFTFCGTGGSETIEGRSHRREDRRGGEGQERDERRREEGGGGDEKPVRDAWVLCYQFESLQAKISFLASDRHAQFEPFVIPLLILQSADSLGERRKVGEQEEQRMWVLLQMANIHCFDCQRRGIETRIDHELHGKECDHEDSLLGRDAQRRTK